MVLYINQSQQLLENKIIEGIKKLRKRYKNCQRQSQFFYDRKMLHFLQQRQGIINYLIIINQTMKMPKRQLHILSSLAETILTFRLQPNKGFNQLLTKMRKKIRTMIINKSFEEEVIQQMFPSKQKYQIKNKINKFKNQHVSNCKVINVQIRIKAIQKQNCQIYNSEIWQFSINTKDQGTSDVQNMGNGMLVIMQNVLRNLLFFSILPINKEMRNKFMLDHKVIISQQQINTGNQKFQNILVHEVYTSKYSKTKQNSKILMKYYYNQSKTQQNMKQIISQRYRKQLQNNKKYSINTSSTSCSRRVSVYQYHDDQLDITVLSNQSINEQSQMYQLEDLNELNIQEQFQLLIEETPKQSADEEFLKNNLNLFHDLLSFNYD